MKLVYASAGDDFSFNRSHFKKISDILLPWANCWDEKVSFSGRNGPSEGTAVYQHIVIKALGSSIRLFKIVFLMMTSSVLVALERYLG